MTGAEFIIKFFKGKKIDIVFGYPGATVLDIYDEIFKSGTPEHILARHEQGAVHAAVGYAKSGGKVGVCIATSGPGATNLITGIADAYLDSVPLIVITGQVDVGFIGRDAFQEADIMGITIPITKHNYLVKSSDVLIRTLEEAWRIATTGRKGPVLVDIARNILSGELPKYDNIESVLPRVRYNDYPLNDALPAVREAIESSYRPVILAGGGVAADSASEKLSYFARESGIPVVTTLMAMGILLDNDPSINLYGMAGMYGSLAANAALSQCDLVIAVGVRFSDRTVGKFTKFSNSRMIIHCDIDPAEISKNVTADIPIVCNAGAFFDEIGKLNIDYNTESVNDWNKMLMKYKVKHELKLPDNRLSSRELLRLIDSIEDELCDAVYVTDVGDHQMTCAREIKSRFERGFITSGGLGAMGFGLPAAIGASFALPDGAKQIILICGDGGFQMTMQELATLKKAFSPVKIFIMNNHSLGMIKKNQRNRFNEHYIASDLPDNPDFCAISAAYGLESRRLGIKDRPFLKETVTEILKSESHIVVDCQV